jgi:hypothetical protein
MDFHGYFRSAEAILHQGLHFPVRQHCQHLQGSNDRNAESIQRDIQPFSIKSHLLAVLTQSRAIQITELEVSAGQSRRHDKPPLTCLASQAADRISHKKERLSH